MNLMSFAKLKKIVIFACLHRDVGGNQLKLIF